MTCVCACEKEREREKVCACMRMGVYGIETRSLKKVDVCKTCVSEANFDPWFCIQMLKEGSPEKDAMDFLKEAEHLRWARGCLQSYKQNHAGLASGSPVKRMIEWWVRRTQESESEEVFTSIVHRHQERLLMVSLDLLPIVVSRTDHSSLTRSTPGHLFWGWGHLFNVPQWVG